MAIKIQGSTIIDDSRNIINSGIATLNYQGVSEVTIGSTNVGIGSTNKFTITPQTTQTAIGIGTDELITLASNSGSDNILQVTNASGSTKHFVVTSDGNIGVGTTNPSEKLHIDGNFLVSDGSIEVLEVNGSSGNPLSIQNSSLNPAFDVTGIGSVGIGTTQPSAIFEVVSGGSEVFRISDTSSDNYLEIDTDKFVVNSSGDAGIGTTNPSGLADPNNTAILNVGVVTANYIYGDGSNLTNLPGFTQDADGNLFAGTNAGGGYDPDTGTSLYNIFLGEDSGAAIANGDHNVFLGYQAGCSVTTGIHNIIFGCRSGCSLQTGSCNVFLGQCAASAATGSSNFVSGHEAGKCMTSGSGNILITQGRSADNGAAWTGSNTVAIGKHAGTRLCGSSSNNVFLGKYSGYCVTTGGSNIFIGDEAGCGSNAKTGSNNVVLGKSAGTNLSSANHNFFGGYKAGECNTTGSYNNFLGCCAGYGGSGGLTGNDNTAIGRDSGKCLTSGACNIFLGYEAGKCVTSGCCNIFLGYQSYTTAPNLPYKKSIICVLYMVLREM
jgi:hypothetical protein